MELDYEQYKLVREALHERRIFLETAPYLSKMLPIMLPIYRFVPQLGCLFRMTDPPSQILANSLLLVGL
jgi:glycerol-3-phosphate dehydrogenase